MGSLNDLDVFIQQHCKYNGVKEKKLAIEISNHFDGMPYDKLSQDSKDVLDVWTAYCTSVDKKIAA